MHQSATTWYGGRPRLRPHCARWGPSSPSKKGAQSPIFHPCLLLPNGCMHQYTTWYGGRRQSRRHCVRWRPSSPPLKEHSPQFSAHVRCGQTAGWTKMPLCMEVGLGSPSNTKSCGLRPSCIPSGILIHAAIWPQQIWANNGLHQHEIHSPK